ncbi:MAG TPA: hypothetical protein ENH23_01365 [candidate division Zixibacteria bacterium]|nr:hypothetical protein [candidate division Zixibacteria bacterium]
MSKSITIDRTESSVFSNSQILKEVGFLSLAVILLSLGIIWFYNRVLFTEEIYGIYSQLEIAGITFMPYMISGAIAALSALYILYYIPAEKCKIPSHQLAMRIRKLGEGDLVSFARIQSGNQEINDIARELSFTVAQWNSQMSQMKIINRQQWDLLQEIKQSAAKNDTDSILLHLEKIEENWIKTAEIEELIKT